MVVHSTLPYVLCFVIWIVFPAVDGGKNCATRYGYEYCSYGCCEDQCCDRETTALGLILGVVFGIILPMALIVTCLVYCFCYGGRHRVFGGRFGRVHHGPMTTVHTGYPGQVVYANQGCIGTPMAQAYMGQQYGMYGYQQPVVAHVSGGQTTVVHHTM